MESFSSEAQLCRCIVIGRESTSGAILVLWSLKYCSCGKYSKQHSTKTRSVVGITRLCEKRCGLGREREREGTGSEASLLKFTMLSSEKGRVAAVRTRFRSEVCLWAMWGINSLPGHHSYGDFSWATDIEADREYKSFPDSYLSIQREHMDSERSFKMKCYASYC